MLETVEDELSVCNESYRAKREKEKKETRCGNPRT
jgi:hypothetical protein